jgi:malonyl-CoA/methylmalonyl-CoA synthetase
MARKFEDSMAEERTAFIPRHDGDHILPADPLFTRLLTIAHGPSQRVAIRDLNTGVERTVADLLSDVLNLRRVLKNSLTVSALQDVQDGKEVFISILAPGGYEFAVGMFACLALGFAASAISIVMPVSEAAYYVQKARSVAVLVAATALGLGRGLEKAIRGSSNSEFVCLPINSSQGSPSISPRSILISSNRYQDPNSAGVIIFTSGTSGPPKAAVLRRSSISDGAMSFTEQINIREGDVLQHLLPVHHATGMWVSFFPFLLAGACIEFKPGNFDPQWCWERWRRGGITHFTGVPTIYMRMMRYYQEHLAKLPAANIQSYNKAATDIRVMICGTSALPQPINEFWTKVRGGHKIVQRYGATETGVVFNMPTYENDDVPDGSVGEPTLGVDVKLSKGNEGEVLMKSFNMFSKYLHDADATKKAHDDEGYYKTGDVARKEGRYYFIMGRSDIDILKSGGYKISALDVERELLALPYISEAMVVGVPDDEFGQRVGAAVSLRTDKLAQDFYKETGRSSMQLDLDDLRSDVRSRLAGYKMPTLLRVVQGEIPKGGTGKVVKKILGPQFFPETYRDDPEVQVWRNIKQELKVKL